MVRQSEITWEERIAAVKLVEEGGRTVLSVANEYGIHKTRYGNGDGNIRSIRKARLPVRRTT